MNDPAAFRHGQTGERILVDLRASMQGLEIRDKRDGLMLARWDYAELTRLPPSKRRGRTLDITCRSDSRARLSIGNRGLIERLYRLAPAVAAPPRRLRPHHIMVASLGAAALGLLVMTGGTGWSPFSGVRSPGNSASGSLAGRICRGTSGQAALDALMRRLTGPLRSAMAVEVARGREIGALALPGGKIVLTQGLVHSAQSADDFAARLAREIARASPHELRPAPGPDPEDALARRLLGQAGIGGEQPPSPGRAAMSDAAWAAVRAICDDD